MTIPVYGLSGAAGLGYSHRYGRRTSTGIAFNNYIEKEFRDSRKKHAVREQHIAQLEGIRGIYEKSAKRINEGFGTAQDAAEMRKAQVLITLENSDYDAYRFAIIIMPYVLDVTEDGYYFTNPVIAQRVADGYEEYDQITEQPEHEQALAGWFKKFWKVITAPVTVPVKAAIKSTKATANLIKAGVQLVQGKRDKAKESLRKAGKYVAQTWKVSVVDPTKDFIEHTKDVVEFTGKVLKVILIKLNPLTILIRNSLRGLLALNIFNFSTRLNVGMMTQAEADSLGYDKKSWENAKKALEKLHKLYKKMGGNVDKLDKSIKHGSKLPPPKIDANTKVKFAATDEESGETSLSMEPATIATLIAACSTVLITIAGWIRETIKRKKEEKAAEDKKKYNLEHYDCDVNGNPILDEYGQPYEKGELEKLKQQKAQAEKEQIAVIQKAQEQEKEEKNKNKKTAIILAASGLVLYFLFNKK